MSCPGALLGWYDSVKRDLPWRQSRDPYRIWVSEIMLQQTRVETVRPYYERFLERFPNVDRLAAAEVDEVLAEWSGLGYYRRARQLHAAARQIVASGEGIPRSLKGLLRLPGIGPYTAAAIASIAFGVPEPVLDGNVERVLGRRLALTDDPKKSGGRHRLLEAARELLDPERPGDSNQALMELGATVCTPRSPRCPECPLAAGCLAFEKGDPESYPPARQRRKAERQRHTAAVAEVDSRVLLFKRPPESSLLAGIWEVPCVAAGGEAKVRRQLERSYGGSWKLGSPHGQIRHTITHRALEVDVIAAEVIAEDRLAEGVEAGWFHPDELGELALSSLASKILRCAGLEPVGS